MTLLVTGGQGFVMSNLVRTWLMKHPGERVAVLDTGAPDEGMLDFLGEAAERVTWLRGDIRDRAWHEPALELGIDRIAHGAAVTPMVWHDAEGNRHDPEREAPERILDINLGGTLAALDFARKLPNCHRFLYVSTGSVYGDEGPADRPLPEDGYVAPIALYGISKYAGEMVVRRYGELFGLSVAAGRLASVYGPMDRILDSRRVVCKPNAMTALALDGAELRLNSAAPVGDYISVRDVADALCLLLSAETTRHFAYNIALGTSVTLAELATLIGRLIPGTTWTVDAESPNLSGNAQKLWGQWGAYDISRLRDEFGWVPRPLDQALEDYILWRRRRRAKGLPA